MPRTKSKTNVSKTASAMNQSMRAITRAAAGEGMMCFASVHALKGNGYFVLRGADGKEFRGTPRGLFTRGTMRVDVGQIVVAEGSPKLGTEIVGVIQTKAEAMALVKSGALPREIFNAAIAAGAVITEPIGEDDDLFEGSDEEAVAEAEAYARGGVRAARSEADARRSVAGLLGRLQGASAGGSTGGGGLFIESAALPEVFAMAEADAAYDGFDGAATHQRRSVTQVVTSAGPRMSIPLRPAEDESAAAPSARAPPSAAQIQAAAQAAAQAASLAAARAALAARSIPENWDDEVNIEDL